MAVRTLGRIGAGAKQAIPALLALFDRSDPSRELRIAAARAMSGIDPEAREVLLLFRSELAAQDLSEASGRYRATLATAILAMSGPDDTRHDEVAHTIDREHLERRELLRH